MGTNRLLEIIQETNQKNKGNNKTNQHSAFMAKLLTKLGHQGQGIQTGNITTWTG
jgi:hypothetical protein